MEVLHRHPAAANKLSDLIIIIYAVAVDCVAVIPCFNEATAIGPLVAAVRIHLPRVIVVDDGSTDSTSAAAREAGAETASLPVNQGKGRALQEGLKIARGLGYTWALLLDGDGQHAPDDIPAFLSLLYNDNADLVIGNRMDELDEMPWTRRVTNRAMSATLSSLSGTALPDTQCGFRLVRLSAWEALDLRGARFEVESEMLIGFLAAGKRVTFIPVQCRYRAERSKIRPLRDGVGLLLWLWRARKQLAMSRVRLKEPSTPPT